ncbi:hypothetical protein [Candidatus Parabeggiatoa sp. HSG14]|uniref:hypothetical protein n=1 Tax=Candidatus Parabeggiatoa sp. HSG14 TaxID=3055593 RepID=UPI0025A6956E|nr:hypothetical protein [Thiotrichales bacterium HSG14]
MRTYWLLYWLDSKHENQVAEPIEVQVYSGQFENTGVHHFYFGYRLAEGTVVYSPESLEVIVTE